MNPATHNAHSLQLVKQHSFAAFGSLCIALFVVIGGALGFSQGGGGGTTIAAPRASYDWARPLSADWRTIYYIVPTPEQGNQILQAERELQSTILENDGTLPSRTIRVIVVDTPEAEDLLAQMLGEASAETVSFIDTRNLPIATVNPADPPLSQAAPMQDEAIVPAAVVAQPASKPYPCSEATADMYVSEFLAGLCR